MKLDEFLALSACEQVKALQQATLYKTVRSRHLTYDFYKLFDFIIEVQKSKLSDVPRFNYFSTGEADQRIVTLRC